MPGGLSFLIYSPLQSAENQRPTRMMALTAVKSLFLSYSPINLITKWASCVSQKCTSELFTSLQTLALPEAAAPALQPQIARLPPSFFLLISNSPNVLYLSPHLDVLFSHYAACVRAFISHSVNKGKNLLRQYVTYISCVSACPHKANEVEATIKNWVTPLLIQLELSRSMALFINSLQSLKCVTYNTSNKVI